MFSFGSSLSGKEQFLSHLTWVIRAVLLGNSILGVNTAPSPGTRPISGKQEHPGGKMTSKNFLEKLDLKIFSKFYLFIFGCAGISLPCTGFSLQWLLLLQRVVSSVPRLQQLWLVGSIVVACKLSCRSACGIFLDQGSNPCPLHWQADS